MKKICLLILMLAVALSACGCKTNIEPEHQAYAISMSIDEKPGGLLSIGVQIPTLGAGSSGDESSGKSSYDTYTATSKTFPEALDLLIATIPAKLVLSHLKAIVVSESLARSHDFGSLISDMITTYQLYGSSALIISKDEALKFIEAQKPAIGTRLSTSLVATIEHYNETGYVPINTLYEVYSQMHSIYSDPVLAYAATSKKSTVDQGSVEQSGGGGGGGSGGGGGGGGSSGGGGGSSGGSSQYGQGEKSPSASMLPGEGTAGELARTGPDVNEFMGCAVTRDGRVADVLTGAESTLLSFIKGSIDSMSYYIDDIATRVKRTGAGGFKVNCKGNSPEVSLELNVYVAAIPTIPDMTVVEEQLTRDVVALIEKTQRMGVELFGLSEVAARQFMTIDGFLEYGFRDKFSKTPVSVRVIAHAEKSG